MTDPFWKISVGAYFPVNTVYVSLNFTGNFIIYVHVVGKKAVFVPNSETEMSGEPDLSVRGTLYCIPVDNRGKHRSLPFCQ